MIVSSSMSLAQLQAERDAWKETARQSQGNADYYRGLVVTIGEMFGEDARTSDDGSVQDGVLCAKVPELVERLRRDLAQALAIRHDQTRNRSSGSGAHRQGEAQGMTDLPRSIQIGAIRYLLTGDEDALKREKLDGRAPDCIGWINHSQAEIGLDVQRSADQVRVSLMHEVLHGVLDILHFTEPAYEDDHFVDALAGALTDTLRRNPSLVAYLAGGDE